MDSGIRRHVCRSGLTAWVCLLAYLVGGVELLPQVLALGASMEGSHRVLLDSSEGRVSVILSHHRSGPACGDAAVPCPPHRHGAAAKLVCLFAPAQTPQADHVALFARASVCTKSTIDQRSMPPVITPDFGDFASSPVPHPDAADCVSRTETVPLRPSDQLALLHAIILVV